jgi:ubiquinone/menaquinone biosynthesis C-methylase UbiE
MAAYLKFRERFRKPEETISFLEIEEGNKVLDFGCGIGSYTIPVAQLVGPSGRVYALDIHPIAIERVLKRARKMDLDNIETIQSGLETGLENASCDHVLLFDVYSWIPNKRALLVELHRILKTGGKLSAIIDHLDPEAFLFDINQFGRFTLDVSNDNFFVFTKK